MSITIVFSPGRINIIGEHTDHQQGLVLPTCINRGLTLYGKISGDKMWVHSDLFGETDEFSTSKILKTNTWRDYIRGTALEFQKLTGIMPRARIYIASNLPSNQGLSSSASLEVGVFYLLQALYEVKLDKAAMIRACWRAENNFVGVKCGMMDQTVIAMAKDSGILIDFNSRNITQLSIPESLAFLLVNTGSERKLSSTKYNLRVKTLSLALEKMKSQGFDHIDNLSNLGVGSLGDIKKIIDDKESFQLIKHVITENKRVITYFSLARENKWKTAGELLYKSHDSLRRDFNASWQKADELVNYCKTISEIHGARMIGGGWGGNILVQLFEKDVFDVSEKLDAFFKDKYGVFWDVEKVVPSRGVHQIFQEVPPIVQKIFQRQQK